MEREGARGGRGMTREEFQKLVTGGLVFLDGATGSNLQKRGMPTGVCPEKWVVDHEDVMLQLQREYVEAGSQILYASTFSGNRIKLAEYGLEEELDFLNKKLVGISKKAAGNRAYVAGDLTMTGEQLKPIGTLEFEELVEIYKEQVASLIHGGVDLFVIETMLSLQETRAAVLAIKESCELPIMATLTFNEGGTTLFGSDPTTAVVVLQGLGVDAVGVNCSAGPDKMVPIIEEMKKYAVVPLIAKPNAGLPYLNEEGETSYDMDKNVFVDHMEKLVAAGANIIGGCCGTTPDYIALLTERMKKSTTIPPLTKKKRTLSSERMTVEIDLNGSMIFVGEKINPTGKKKLQAELREGNFDTVLEFAKNQEEAGAKVLDVNVGMNGIDEQEIMLQAISEITQITSLPLCIDTSHLSVMEAALRQYPGRALINSISLEKGKLETLLPLAKKYGAMFILLPLSEKGLPKSLEEKMNIIHKILEEAKKIGLDKEDVIVDGLVTTIGANKLAGIETLSTISYCKEQLEVGTIVGLSNISFGLPERVNVNSAFLTMAIQSGLTMAIADPLNQQLMKSAFAADVLMNKEGADLRYIEGIERFPKEVINEKKVEKKEKNPVKEKKQDDFALEDREIYDEVVKGARKKIVETVKIYLDKGYSASEILDTMLIPGINRVSELFDQQKYFLPQLIASAEAMKKAIGYLEPMLFSGSEEENKPVIVIATVEGDIHDIGKNLVAMMLKNYGYRVIDLGKDVSKEMIVETALKEDAKIIGLSALMTTTMQEMKRVIEYSKEKGCKAKIMIGGAVITPSYAQEIGADGYSKDATEAVRLVQKLLEE